MSVWLYVGASLVVPAAWGVVMFYLVEALKKRRRAKERADEPPPIDYSI